MPHVFHVANGGVATEHGALISRILTSFFLAFFFILHAAMYIEPNSELDVFRSFFHALKSYLFCSYVEHSQKRRAIKCRLLHEVGCRCIITAFTHGLIVAQ